MDQAILTSLIKTGLSDRQARVYLALTELGDSPVSSIAEKAQINRSLTYSVLEELIKLGYARQSDKRSVRRYSAASPQKVFQSVRANLENLKFMLPLIQALYNQGEKKPRIELFEDPEAIINVYRSFDDAKQRRFISSFEHVKKLFPHELERWTQRMSLIKSHSSTKELLVDDTASRTFQKRVAHIKNVEVRFLSQDTQFSMDFAIADDIFALTNFDPAYIVVIHSKDIARSANILFDLAWKGAKRP